MEVSPWPYVLDVVKTLGVGVAIWITVVFLISRMGWAAFARRYATAIKPAPSGFRAIQARFGFPLAGYRNVLYVTFMREGIYLKATFPFNVGHRPLLLPWPSVADTQVKRALFGERFILMLRSEAGTLDLTLPVEAQAAFEAARPAG